MERVVARDAFDGDELEPVHRGGEHEARVDRHVARLAVGSGAHDRDRARAALAFGAAFFGAGEPARAEEVQEGFVRVDGGGLDVAPIQTETDAHGKRVP